MKFSRYGSSSRISEVEQEIHNQQSYKVLYIEPASEPTNLNVTENSYNKELRTLLYRQLDYRIF